MRTKFVFFCSTSLPLAKLFSFRSPLYKQCVAETQQNQRKKDSGAKNRTRGCQVSNVNTSSEVCAPPPAPRNVKKMLYSKPCLKWKVTRFAWKKIFCSLLKATGNYQRQVAPLTLICLLRDKIQFVKEYFVWKSSSQKPNNLHQRHPILRRTKKFEWSHDSIMIDDKSHCDSRDPQLWSHDFARPRIFVGARFGDSTKLDNFCILISFGHLK